MTDCERDFSWLKLQKRKRLPLRLGINATGELEVLDLAVIHALLLTGPTGCGKSVVARTLIDSMMSAKTPKDFKLLLIDGKGIEFTDYEEDLPFLLSLPVTSEAKIRAAIQWLSRAIEKRNVRRMRPGDEPDIVVVIDGMVFVWGALAEIENEFWYCVGQGNSVGVHFIVTSQSIEFENGHETSFPCHLKMTGTGHMRGVYDEREIDVVGEDLGDETLTNVYGRYRTAEPSLVDFVNIDVLKQRKEAQSAEEYARKIRAIEAERVAETAIGDEEILQAIDVIIRTGRASTSHFQRNLAWSYNHAASVLNKLSDLGIVGPAQGMGPRIVLWQKDRLSNFRAERRIREANAEMNAFMNEFFRKRSAMATED